MAATNDCCSSKSSSSESGLLRSIAALGETVYTSLASLSKSSMDTMDSMGNNESVDDLPNSSKPDPSKESVDDEYKCDPSKPPVVAETPVMDCRVSPVYPPDVTTVTTATTVTTVTTLQGTTSIIDFVVNYDKEMMLDAPVASQKPPRVVFVVDISGSMQTSQDNLIASLLALQDCIIGSKMVALSGDKKEIPFRGLIDAHLIVFSDKHTKIYPDNETFESWATIVKNIRAGGGTYMGEAILKGFEEFKDGSPGWLITMTDGDSQGRYTSVEHYKELVKLCPENVEMITLGYGYNYRPDILNVLGKYTHVPDADTIPSVFGCIAAEVLGSWGIKATLNLCPTPDLGSIIAEPIGNEYVGSLFQGRKFVHAKMFTESLEDVLAKDYMWELSYINVASNKRESLAFKLEPGVPEVVMEQVEMSFEEKKKAMMDLVELAQDAESLQSIKINEMSEKPVNVLPLKYRAKYYEKAKADINSLLQLVAKTEPRSVLEELVESFKKQLNCWVEECSLPHKKELLDIFEKMLSQNHHIRRTATYQAFAISSTSAQQYDYSRPDTVSASSASSAKSCSTAYQGYMGKSACSKP